MKHALIIGLLTIVIAAILMATQAFVWVFTTIIHYGLISLVIAAVVYLYFWSRSKRKKKENGSNDKK